MVNVSRQENNNKHLWSDTILPDTRYKPINRSMSLSDESKPRYTAALSNNLIQTLDTLSLSNDGYVQGR